MTMRWDKHGNYPHFMDEKNKALVPHSWRVAEQGLNVDMSLEFTVLIITLTLLIWDDKNLSMISTWKSSMPESMEHNFQSHVEECAIEETRMGSISDGTNRNTGWSVAGKSCGVRGCSQSKPSAVSQSQGKIHHLSTKPALCWSEDHKFHSGCPIWRVLMINMRNSEKLARMSGEGA